MQPMNEVTFKETQLPPLEKNKKTKPSFSDRFFTVLLIVLLILLPIATGYFGQIIYNNVNYSHFFVNGMSMYPTINFNAYATDSNGTRVDLSYTDGNFTNTNYTYRCETGLSDESEGYLDRIERFTIVCTFYSDDYTNGVLNSGAARKIKRVIGMPGESLYFDSNGDLYIKEVDADDYEKIDEPFFEEQSWWTDDVRSSVEAGKHSYANKAYGYGRDKAVELGEGEYFVCGDNRTYSADSRTKGKVLASYIQGIVILINGQTNYYWDSASNDWITNNNIFDLYAPWDYKRV